MDLIKHIMKQVQSDQVYMFTARDEWREVETSALPPGRSITTAVVFVSDEPAWHVRRHSTVPMGSR